MGFFGLFKPNIDDLTEKKDVQGLINASKTMYSVDQTARIIDGLKKIGNPSVLPLIESLKSDDYHISGMSIQALGETGDKRAINPLLSFLNKNKLSHYDVEQVINSLQKLGWTPSNKTELIYYYIATENFIELEKFGNKAAGPVSKIISKDFLINFIALLGKIGDASCVDSISIPLFYFSQYHEKKKFFITLNSMINIGGRDALPYLYKALKIIDDATEKLIINERYAIAKQSYVIPLAELREMRASVNEQIMSLNKR